MPGSVQQTFVGRENGTDTKNGCKEAIPEGTFGLMDY